MQIPGISLQRVCQPQFFTNASISSLNPCKPISSLPFQFPPLSFSFPGNSVRRKFTPGVESVGRRLKNTMTETRASSDGTGDDEFMGATAFDQEALIDASSPHNHIAGGLQAIMNHLSKWFIAATFGVVILLRHDAEALWAALGSILNVVLSTTLKQILNQERPVSALSSGPGMPSSHAQSIFFIAVFVILSMIEWLGLNVLATILSGLVIALGTYFSWLRVSQNYHTISQVTVGAAVGSIFSILWFWMWNEIVLKAYTSHLWVRIIVILGAASCCVLFILHVIRYWIMDENQDL